MVQDHFFSEGELHLSFRSVSLCTPVSQDESLHGDYSDFYRLSIRRYDDGGILFSTRRTHSLVQFDDSDANCCFRPEEGKPIFDNSQNKCLVLTKLFYTAFQCRCNYSVEIPNCPYECEQFDCLEKSSLYCFRIFPKTTDFSALLIEDKKDQKALTTQIGCEDLVETYGLTGSGNDIFVECWTERIGQNDTFTCQLPPKNYRHQPKSSMNDTGSVSSSKINMNFTLVPQDKGVYKGICGLCFCDEVEQNRSVFRLCPCDVDLKNEPETKHLMLYVLVTTGIIFIVLLIICGTYKLVSKKTGKFQPVQM
ncbi:uncharacterized protein LOC106664231 isoform X2 [Cimex lectularius]|uniref:Uncharacterized protein n=1 Tax=Cimex lectularius TaxID=79782 RepID=A0A8I6SP02_CIMLE|nr:uncharacterized protein LOC106664231 isoform X2 [Cimex lectularius]